MCGFGRFVELCALFKQRSIDAIMSLSGRDMMDSAVTMLMGVLEMPCLAFLLAWEWHMDTGSRSVAKVSIRLGEDMVFCCEVSNDC